MLAITSLKAATQPLPFREYQIKAVFLYNFAQFVEWPPAAFSNDEAPLIIGVLGEDPFGKDLDLTAAEERVGARSLQVLRFRRIEDVDTCHILFISGSEFSRLESVLAALHGRSILTVSDGNNFSRRGGMIRFVTENNKVRMRINLEATRTAGLTVSSKLLRAAEVVRNGGN